jgi:hypothetical protein
MARLSLWKNYKSKDYYFLDRTVREQFEIGGTGIFIHKYTGPVEADGVVNPDELTEITIQDLTFLENRDRKYDPDVYEMKGHYQVSDHDFDLSQFGLFLQTDTVYITFHLNEMVERIGRKLMSGDVLELQHLRDDMGLDESKAPSRKFYVVQDASRASEGYTPTWYPHIWRVKCVPLEDTQEFKQILELENDDGTTIKDTQTSLQTALNITDAIVAAAEENDPNGASCTAHLANYDPETFVYNYGADIPEGETFPSTPRLGDKFIRTDFVPHRLFEYRDNRWHRLYDNIDQNTWATKTINGATFVNNSNTTVVGGKEFDERQPLSKVIKPKTDN